jgi:hypothetical protein
MYGNGMCHHTGIRQNKMHRFRFPMAVIMKLVPFLDGKKLSLTENLQNFEEGGCISEDEGRNLSETSDKFLSHRKPSFKIKL